MTQQKEAKSVRKAQPLLPRTLRYKVMKKIESFHHKSDGPGLNNAIERYINWWENRYYPTESDTSSTEEACRV